MLKSQREAAPSDSASSPAKFGTQPQMEPVQNIRLKPQGVAPALQADAVSQHDNYAEQAAPGSAKKSVSSSASPAPNSVNRFSMMQTADEASAYDNSIMVDNDFDRREFNEIDILGALNRDDKGNVIVPIDEASGARR